MRTSVRGSSKRRRISAGPLSPSGAAASPMTLKLDADIKQKAGGSDIEHAKVKLNVNNAPIAVADAIAHMGGALVEGVGDTANITADIDGNMEALTAAVKLTSAGLSTDANFALKDGVLRGSTTGGAGGKPVMMSLKSTAFLQRLPQTRESVASAVQQIRLTQRRVLK